MFSSKRANLARIVIRHGILLVTAGFVLVPFVWMLSLSIKPPGEMFRASFSLFPSEFHGWENYMTALTRSPMPRFILNGVIVCTSIVLLQLLLCAPAAYALAKLRFPGRDALFALVLICLLIPRHVIALPLFLMSHGLGVLNTYVALIFPYIVTPFGIFLLRQFFKTIPDDIIHAARLDGMSEFAIIWRVVIPMSLPAVAAFAIFSVVSHWNDLFWPLIAVRSEELMPPPLGVLSFRNEETGADYGPLMAGATIVVLPLVLAFLLAQRWFVESLTMRAMK